MINKDNYNFKIFLSKDLDIYKNKILDLDITDLIKFTTKNRLNLFDCLYIRKLNNRPYLIPFEILPNIINKYDLDTIVQIIFNLVNKENMQLNCVLDIKSYFTKEYEISNLKIDKNFLHLISIIFPFSLYSYQFKAIEKYTQFISESNVESKGIIITAPTGMGKSFTYILPILRNAILFKSNSIIIYPLKALINDQFSILVKCQDFLNEYGYFFQISILDGDTPFYHPENTLELYKLKFIEEKIVLQDRTQNNSMDINLKYKNDILEEEVQGRIFNLQGREDHRIVYCPFCNAKSSFIYLREKGKYRRFEIHSVRPFSICQKCKKIIFSPWAIPEINAFHPQIILTTPDKLHRILQDPDFFWIFMKLICIGIDEIHTYRGYLGINTHFLIQRLKKVCREYHKFPIFIGTSATITSPSPFFSKLAGIEPKHIFHSDFKTLIYQNKDVKLAKKFYISKEIFPLYNRSGKFNLLICPNSDINTQNNNKLFFSILKTILYHSYLKKIIVFGNSRQIIEKLARDFDKYLVYNFNKLNPGNGELSCYNSFSEKDLAIIKQENIWEDNFQNILDIKSRVHKGALLIEKRVKIESEFKAGDIDVIFATPTMELGIDIGDLDCAILHGLPNELDKFIQRIGRVGRKSNLSLVLTYMKGRVIDLFFLKNPKKLYELDPIEIPLNINNSKISELHEKAAINDIESFFQAERGRSKLHTIVDIDFRNAFQSINVFHNNKLIYSSGIDQIISEINGNCEYYYNKKAFSAKPVFKSEFIYIQNYSYVIPLRIELLDEHPKKEHEYPILKKIIENTDEPGKYIIHIINLTYKPFIGYKFETTGNRIFLKTSKKPHIISIMKLIIGAISILIEIDQNLLDYIIFDNDYVLLFEKGIGGYGISDFFEKKSIVVLNYAKNLLESCDCVDGCPKCTFQDIENISKKELLNIIDILLTDRLADKSI